MEVHPAPRGKKLHLGQHLLSLNHAAPLSNFLNTEFLNTRTSTLYLLSILLLQAIPKYVLAGLEPGVALADKCSGTIKANIYLENYSFHLTVSQT